jgi:hypothetical protein
MTSRDQTVRAVAERLCRCGHPRDTHGFKFGCWEDLPNGLLCPCMQFQPRADAGGAREGE